MVIDAQFKTIKCDGGSDCTKTITFNVAEGKEVARSGNKVRKQ